jgi:hypothetical protein
LSVPLQAISHQADQVSVFAVTPQSTIVIRPVTLGIQTANDAEVLSGLTEGELVVVSDRSGLRSGEKVRTHSSQTLEYHEEGGAQP